MSNGNGNTNESSAIGRLQLRVTAVPGFKPVENAEIKIGYTGEEFSYELVTDNNGLAGPIELPAPPLEYSLEPDMLQPYADYTVSIEADGYQITDISNIQILPDTTAILDVRLSEGDTQSDEVIDIAPHTLYFDYPPKIFETEIKPVADTGEIVLSSVVIPEYIVVHDGPPTDSNAADYYVPYLDYIKNVASSEIYATWPIETIKANILVIMSFTLNRVYTEFYRNRGYSFTITSSTAYDQKWIRNRNIYESISEAVEELFTSYLSRPSVRQPILTQYCDGDRVKCPGKLSQWGSKTLGDQGYSAIEIIRYYYGDNMYINNTSVVAGVPVSWPGYLLEPGSSGQPVSQIQEQLNSIAESYPALPSINVDGIYGDETRNAVEEFQSIFSLPITGNVDFRTWYKISGIYVAVNRIAEL